jgi:hypothetical protein
MLNDGEDVGDGTKKLLKAYRKIVDKDAAAAAGTLFLYTCLDVFVCPYIFSLTELPQLHSLSNNILPNRYLAQIPEKSENSAFMFWHKTK